MSENYDKNKKDEDLMFDLSNITPKTFDITAQKWAGKIYPSTKINQIRNFYEKILEFTEQAANCNSEKKEEEFKQKILPFVKMLNSKVAYAQNNAQSKINYHFATFMRIAIKQVSDTDSLSNFKYLLEAVIGFCGDNPNKNKTQNNARSNK